MKPSLFVASMLAIAAVGAPVFAASTPSTPSPTPSTAANAKPKNSHKIGAAHHTLLNFNRVSQALGITRATLIADFKHNESIAAIAWNHNVTKTSVTTQLRQDFTALLKKQVAAGTMTQTREQDALTRFNQHLTRWLDQPGRFWMQEQKARQLLMLSSHALNLKPGILAHDLRQGQTIAAVAKNAGISETALEAKLNAEVKSRLSKRVESGSMTSSQEQAAIERFDKNLSHRLTTPIQHKPPSKPKNPGF